MTYLTDVILGDVARERIRQDKIWGEQTRTEDEWLTILGEEFGEACKAALAKDGKQYIKELIETAAVCVCAVEDHTRQLRRNKMDASKAS